MTLQLRPANLGEILDRTAAMYRSRFLVFVGIGVIPAGGVLVFATCGFLLSAWINPSDPTSTALLGLAILLLVMIAIPACLGLTALGSAALSHAANLAFLGEPVTIRGAYRAAWKHGWRYVGLLSLQILFLAVIPFSAWFLIVAGLAVMVAVGGSAGIGAVARGASTSTALLLIAGGGLVVYFFWMLLRLCLAFSASVVEEIGAWAALKRATLLSSGTRGRILVVYLLCAVLSWIVSLVMTVPVIIVLSLIPQLNTPQHQQTIASLFLFLMYASSFAAQAFTRPVSGIAMLHFYYDARIRKEAFDIEWMMRVAGLFAGPQSPANVAPLPENAAWMPPAGIAQPSETESFHPDGAQQNATGESS
jgi:hypothetical protein